MKTEEEGGEEDASSGALPCQISAAMADFLTA